MRARGPTAALLVGMVACATSCADFHEYEDVAYDSRYGGDTLMDVYVPAAAKPGTPAVMLIHGGGWSSFSKEVYNDHAARLADAGYVTASINYRLAPEGAYPLLIQDVFCALGYLQAHADDYSLDPRQVAVAGYSAGGHLASLVAVAEPVDDFEPDCGFVPAFKPALAISGAGPEDMTLLPEGDALVSFLGGTEDEVPEVYERASPITHVSADDPPFLFIHGTDDLFVSFEHTRRMSAALDDVGVETRVLRMRGGGHLTNPGGDLYDAVLPITTQDGPEAWAATVDFLDRHLERP